MKSNGSSSDSGIVIIGGGLAAAKAAETLREEGFEAPMTIVCAEAHRPYERPPLSKEYLQGDDTDVYVHPEKWYDDHDVRLILGDAAATIDAAAGAVELDSGERLRYDKLLITTGSRPRTLDLPGADLDGIFTLRNIEDSDALREAFSTAKRVAIIGAGWIGLETAAAARAAGLGVTVLEYAPLPLQRVLGDELAEYFANLHRTHGVDLRLSTSVEGFTGSGGKVTAVQTDGGIVETDMVIVGVGIAPNVEIAERAGISIDNGISVDERMRTHTEHVYAAGDVANALNTALGHSLRVEHWDNAIRQGQTAARAMLGQDTSYDWQPYFFSDQYDLGMEYVGFAQGGDEVVIRGDMGGDKGAGEFVAFWLRGDRVVAGMNVNVWDVSDDIRVLIDSKQAVDRARLADPGVELTALT